MTDHSIKSTGWQAQNIVDMTPLKTDGWIKNEPQKIRTLQYEMCSLWEGG